MDIRHAGIRRIADASDLGTVTNAQVLQYNSATKKFDGVTLSLSDSTISGTLPIAKVVLGLLLHLPLEPAWAW